MQDVAREMNLSETAFLLHRPDGYGLRWFTPAVEVDLCGHATLASALVLWERGGPGAGGDGAVSHAQRIPDGRPAGRLDRARFPCRRADHVGARTQSRDSDRRAPLPQTPAAGGAILT
jgi:hypothetical protein